MGELDPVAIENRLVELEARLGRLERAKAYEKRLFAAASTAMRMRLGDERGARHGLDRPSDVDIASALELGFLTPSDVAAYRAPARTTAVTWWRRALQRLTGRGAGDAA
jgi:hypothetical protein